MTAFGVNTAGSLTSNTKIPALLDSGTSLTYLPPNLAAAIFRKYNLEFNSHAGAAVIPCSARSRRDTMIFTFSGATIAVPFSELVLDVVTSSDPAVEEFVCAFGIAPAVGEDGLSVLGDTFLRSAYVVYDLQNNEISLAQTRFDSSLPDDILEITKNGVPDAAVEPGSDTAKAKVSGVPGSGDLSGGRGTNAAGPGVSTASVFGVISAGLGAVGVGMWLL